MTVNSFFAGIGGFDLGLENVGFQVLFQCEINDFCNQVLKRHWPNTLSAKDIRGIESQEIPEADLWCGGFPCQDLSLARGSNGRLGLKGKESGLFYDFLKLVESRLPNTILLENVTGLLSSHKGNDFKIIIDSLTNLGYGVAWRVLNTRYFGAPQSRPRVYICASKGSAYHAVNALFETQAASKPTNPRLDFMNVDFHGERGVKVPKVGYCLAATSGRHTGTDWSRTYISYFDTVRRLTPTEAERLQGFPTDWTRIDKKNGDIDSQRYHAVGNAVSVPVVEWIGRRILQLPNEGVEHSTQLSKITKEFADLKFGTRHFIDNGSLQLWEHSEQPTYQWKSGGFAFGGEVLQCQVESSPATIVDSRLCDLLDENVTDQKYFLSPSAARGIIRRVTSQNRKLFVPLLEALLRLAESNYQKNEINEILFDTVGEG